MFSCTMIAGSDEILEMDAEEAVFTAGETDGFGCFQLADPVERGQQHNLVVIADSYAPVEGDGIVLAQEDDPATVNLRDIHLASER